MAYTLSNQQSQGFLNLQPYNFNLDIQKMLFLYKNYAAKNGYRVPRSHHDIESTRWSERCETRNVFESLVAEPGILLKEPHSVREKGLRDILEHGWNGRLDHSGWDDQLHQNIGDGTPYLKIKKKVKIIKN